MRQFRSLSWYMRFVQSPLRITGRIVLSAVEGVFILEPRRALWRVLTFVVLSQSFAYQLPYPCTSSTFRNSRLFDDKFHSPIRSFYAPENRCYTESQLTFSSNPTHTRHIKSGTYRRYASPVLTIAVGNTAPENCEIEVSTSIGE